MLGPQHKPCRLWVSEPGRRGPSGARLTKFNIDLSPGGLYTGGAQPQAGTPSPPRRCNSGAALQAHLRAMTMARTAAQLRRNETVALWPHVDGWNSQQARTAEGNASRRVSPALKGLAGRIPVVKAGALPRRLPAPGEAPKKGGLSVKFARTCAGLGAVCSVGIALALLCDHLAALLDAAIAIC